MLIITSGGAQILALALDVALKLRYLADTIAFACEENGPPPIRALRLINSTIADMEINFSRGAMEEKKAIESIINTLSSRPELLCPRNQTAYFSLTQDQAYALLGNVTVSLFSTLGITPSTDRFRNIGGLALVTEYFELIRFVFVYYFVAISLAIAHFSLFMLLAHRHTRKLHRAIAISARLALAIILASLTSLAKTYGNLPYYVMTSPIIVFTFALTLFVGKLFQDPTHTSEILLTINRSSRRSSSGLAGGTRQSGYYYYGYGYSYTDVFRVESRRIRGGVFDYL
jgi:hypothetical protein